MTQTVKDVVQEFGGRIAVSKLVGISPNGVTNAVRRNRMPSSWHMTMFNESKRRKIDIDPSLFDVKRNRA